MGLRTSGVATVLALLAFSVATARAADPAQLFQEGVRHDLAGDAKSAFALYRKAGKLGFPEAEFNVAAMLDSGRGVASDVSEAATWYARAAAHRNKRAAYSLGLLYEAGVGVPRNASLSLAWFKASGLPAAYEHTSINLVPKSEVAQLSVPNLMAPLESAEIDPSVGGVELVWTSSNQPKSSKFFVEVRVMRDHGSDELFSTFVDTSSVFVALPPANGNYIWRVVVVAERLGRYSSSGWLDFSVEQARVAKRN